MKFVEFWATVKLVKPTRARKEKSFILKIWILEDCRRSDCIKK
jgi:hypothetical protein